LNDLWQIALRESWSDNGEDGSTTHTFTKAPPWMVLEAAGKIPGLIEELINRTREMRANLTAKNAELQELAAVLAIMAGDVGKKV
jgi:hypothetical protein